MKELKEKASQVKDKAQSVTETMTEKLNDVKDVTQEHLGTAKDLTADQWENIKSEAQDMKKIFQSKDMIYMKTDALAIVLRKLGKTEEFLQIIDKLTKEGYRLVHHEIVREIPIAGGFNFPIGSFYFLQRAKYIT